MDRKLERNDFEEDNQNDIISQNSEKDDSLHKIYINNLLNYEYYKYIKLLITKDLETKIKNDI